MSDTICALEFLLPLILWCISNEKDPRILGEITIKKGINKGIPLYMLYTNYVMGIRENICPVKKTESTNQATNQPRIQSERELIFKISNLHSPPQRAKKVTFFLYL